jgi:hypothetical protein
MNTIELKKAIYAFLATKCGRTYPEQVPHNTAYPFVTYSLRSSFADENQRMEVFFLDIDVWDNKPMDTTDLETLVGQIDGDGSLTAASGLHRRHYYAAGILRADFYREGRLEIDDDDPAIRRRLLQYTVYAYLE